MTVQPAMNKRITQDFSSRIQVFKCSMGGANENMNNFNLLQKAIKLFNS